MTDTTIQVLPICVDKYLEGERYDKSKIPSYQNLRTDSREELALERVNLWQPGQTLRIRFLDGSDALHQRVATYAREWLDYANLHFEFGNFPDAEIRVTFKGNGYSSYVGSYALQIGSPDPTMILGGFTEDMDKTEMKRVVLHEFGHAIGCVHEQASPSINIPWNKEAVYRYYWDHYRWPRKDVCDNIFMRYTASEVEYTEAHDPLSIMQYPVNQAHTHGDFEIGWNNELSEGDKVFIATIYPK